MIYYISDIHSSLSQRVFSLKRGRFMSQLSQVLWSLIGILFLSLNIGYAQDQTAKVKEPSVRKVQKVALQYAALNPEIFKNMRSRSRIQAALPQVTIRATQDNDNESRSLTRYGETELAQDISATKVVGDDLQLYAEARWKLSETVFNYQETAVMRENRYSAKERQKLLQTVTQTYFERKRTVIKLKRTKSGTQSHELLVLKLMQIEAELDALTGGWFTQQINAATLGE